MVLGEETPLKLAQWLWLHTGIDRRFLGWNGVTASWVISPPIATVGSSRPGTPPTWATAANHRAVLLSAPALEMTDAMLEAIDQFRSQHPVFQRHTVPALTARLWRLNGDCRKDGTVRQLA